jgi:ribosomal protein L37AE/L43A
MSQHRDQHIVTPRGHERSTVHLGSDVVPFRGGRWVVLRYAVRHHNVGRFGKQAVGVVVGYGVEVTRPDATAARIFEASAETAVAEKYAAIMAAMGAPTTAPKVTHLCEVCREVEVTKNIAGIEHCPKCAAPVLAARERVTLNRAARAGSTFGQTLVATAGA